jgi:hypothetical protein
MKQYKIPQSFKFSEQTMCALRKLAKLPIYGTKTRVLESLVFEKAEELNISRRNSDNGKNSKSSTK